MDLPGGLAVNGHLVQMAEHYVQIEAAGGFTRGWNARVANQLYAQRAQYPFHGNTITYAQAVQVASWAGLAFRGAQQLHAYHFGGPNPPPRIAHHPGYGPGHFVNVQFTINFGGARENHTIFREIRFGEQPDWQDMETAIMDAAQEWAFTYGAPTPIGFLNAIYFRYVTG